jgi:hypothetical protein
VALTVPGVGVLLEAELASKGLGQPVATGNDGRADVVIFRPAVPVDEVVAGLQSAEDVLVQVGHATGAQGDRPEWIAQRLLRRARLVDAVHSGAARPGDRRFRVIARVLSERTYLRTDLRRAVVRAATGLLPGWAEAEGDTAPVELWVLEYRPGRLAAGVRLTDLSYRQRGGRRVERRGALRPAVARAMVGLVPPQARAVLLDPFCGGGSILEAAGALGFAPVGFDLAADAVAAAAQNAPGVALARADAVRLPLPAGSVAAVVSNLPFGRQYAMPADPERWLRTVMTEWERVLAPGGRAVSLTGQPVDRAARGLFRIEGRWRIRLLGDPAVLTLASALPVR